jgi:hypothetical protein
MLRSCTESNSWLNGSSIVIVAILWAHGPIRDEYCHDIEYCEQQQPANLAVHGNRFCSSTMRNDFRFPSKADLENGSGDFEQPSRAHAAWAPAGNGCGNRRDRQCECSDRYRSIERHRYLLNFADKASG